MILFSAAALAAGFCASASAVAAGDEPTLREIRARQAEERKLANEVAYTNRVCSTSISASIDWARASRWPAGKSLTGACDVALSALEAVCRTDNGRTRAAKVTSFTCSADGSGPALSGGRLRYGAGGRDNFSSISAWLDDRLK